MISVFTTSPFRQDRPKFHAYTICVLAIDPFLTLRVVFPAYRNTFVVRKVCKGKRLPCDFAGAEVGSGVKWNGNNKRCSETSKRFHYNCVTRDQQNTFRR